MYYAYILESEHTGRWYYGSTENLERRIAEHNTGRVDSTKYGQPWKLIYQERFSTKEAARVRERYFKSTRNKIYLKELLELDRPMV